MDMRMQAEVLTPGMKHTDRPAFHSKMTVAESPQGIPDCGKKVIVKPPAIEKTDRIQFFRNGKDNMKMFYRISIFNTVFNPKSLFGCLALGTMAVAAAIVADLFFPATITTVFMPAQCRSPALHQGIEGTQLVGVWIASLNKPTAKAPDDFSYLMLWPAHKASL